jgi:hypothetical protein
MNVGWGGAQAVPRDSLITAGCLGPHDPLLHLGDIALHNWPPSVETQNIVESFDLVTNSQRINEMGPFDLTPLQRLVQCHDRSTTQTQIKPKTKQEILHDLEQEGITMPRGLGHGRKELQEIAKNKGIATTKSVSKTTAGFLGKQKGLKQVCRERGLIVVENCNGYTKQGRKLPDGTFDKSTSLAFLLSQCQDFRNEKTHLQVLAEAIGISVDFTPKFHPELPGEGVEYTWAALKQKYRREPLRRKKTRDAFKELVRECVEKERSDPARIKSYSARARAYICTYHYIAKQNNQKQQQAVASQEQQQQQPAPKEEPTLLLREIEQLAKEFRTHRCAFHFDKGFLDVKL